jgi:hypothetical protein
MECDLQLHDTYSSKDMSSRILLVGTGDRGEGGRLPFISTKSTTVQARSVFCISARISRVLEQRLEVFVAGAAVVFILFIKLKG